MLLIDDMRKNKPIPKPRKLKTVRNEDDPAEILHPDTTFMIQRSSAKLIRLGRAIDSSTDEQTAFSLGRIAVRHLLHRT